MRPLALCLAVVFALLALPSEGRAQPTVTDPEVLKGIDQVEQGDYDTAIFTLDTAARRLTGDPQKAQDLSQAYLYLGIAYFGKGHEAAAKAKFREAIKEFRDLSLSAEQYPPKIIDLFEAAREETDVAPAPAAAPAAAAAAAGPVEEKKGGSKTMLVLGGVGAAAAVGIAVGAGGGDGGSSPTPATPSGPPIQTETFMGTLDLGEYCRHWQIAVQSPGRLEANLTWEQPRAQLGMEMWNNPDWVGDPVAMSNRLADTNAVLQHDVSPGGHIIEACHLSSPCEENFERTGDLCPTNFNLTVRHP